MRARAPYEIIAGMSEGNVELVRALIDRWNERGEAALDAYHDDVEWDFTGWDFEVEGTWRGMEGLESVLEGLRERWEEVRVEPEQLIDRDDKVGFFGRFFARRRYSGLEVSDSGTCVFTLRDGKISAFSLYRAREDALNALGLAEWPALGPNNP